MSRQEMVQVVRIDDAASRIMDQATQRADRRQRLFLPLMAITHCHSPNVVQAGAVGVDVVAAAAFKELGREILEKDYVGRPPQSHQLTVAQLQRASLGHRAVGYGL